MQGKKENIDKRLILQLREGNKMAFSQVFRDYSQRLYFFSFGYLKSEKDAEEIVQDTFLKLWERRESLNPDLSFHAYLFKIAFNFIQKRLIKMVKDEEFKHDLAGELVHFDQHTTNRADYHFLLQHISKLMEQLPPRQKQILELRKLEGYSVQEISEYLNIAPKTVEAHLTAALKFLKQQLQSDQFDDLVLLSLTFKFFF